MNKQLRAIRKDLRKSLDEKFNRLEKVRTKISKLYLPDFPVNPTGSIGIFRAIELEFPYDPQVIKEIRDLMKADGWSEHEMIQDHQQCNYYKDGMSIEIDFCINHEDSTCIKTKIGEQETTISIYEVSCKEGGEEKTFIHKEVKEND